jgi:hypothetical protein
MKNNSDKYTHGNMYFTKDYGIFDVHECNRDIREDPILSASFEKHGFMPSGAIHVCNNDAGRLCIIRGHHRFYEAQKQDTGIYFIVDNTPTEIFDLERSGHALWSVKDWCIARGNQGNLNYGLLIEFQKRHGVTASTAACLLGGDTGVSGNKSDAIKSGKYRVVDNGVFAENVMAVVNACYCAGIEHAKSTAFIGAMAGCLRTAEFNRKVFIDKVRRRPTAIRKCTNRYDYVREIDSLYNFGSKTPIALEHLVRATLQGRIPKNFVSEKK